MNLEEAGDGTKDMKADMIVSMDLTRYKYSVFSQNLLLLNKVNFN